jgi:hypothetical protein
MRRPHVTIWQLMATVAVAAVLLWGGTLARDYFWPPPAPPLLPITAPELPEGLWFPYPGSADRPAVYFNMDEAAKGIRPPRTIVFRLDRAKRRWVRDYKSEELGRKASARWAASQPASGEAGRSVSRPPPSRALSALQQPPIPEPELPDGEWLADPPSPSTADMRIWTRADDVLCNIHPPRKVIFRLDRSKRLWVRDYTEEAPLRKPPVRTGPNIPPSPGRSVPHGSGQNRPKRHGNLPVQGPLVPDDAPARPSLH